MAYGYAALAVAQIGFGIYQTRRADRERRRQRREQEALRIQSVYREMGMQAQRLSLLGASSASQVRSTVNTSTPTPQTRPEALGFVGEQLSTLGQVGPSEGSTGGLSPISNENAGNAGTF